MKVVNTMASNLIFRIASEFEAKGTDDATKGLEKVRQQMEKTATASSGIATGVMSLFKTISGVALALPLAGFIKEAIRSEEVTARFRMQLESLGQTIEDIDIEGLSDRVRDLGITQTEFVSALASGLTYLKDTDKELALLNTALGLSKSRGIDLSTAFRILGQVTAGYTMIARRYGVSTHSEIKDKTERTAAVLAEFTKKFAPLAEQTNTVSEALKKMSAHIKDAGESLGATFLPMIGGIVNGFNKLSDNTQELVVWIGLLTSAGIGLTAAIVPWIPALAAAGITIGTLILPITLLAAEIAFFTHNVYLNDQAFIKSGETLAKYYNMVAKAMLTRAGDLGKEIDLTQDLTVTIADLKEQEKLLGIKIAEAAVRGEEGIKKQAEADLKVNQERLKNFETAEKYKEKTGLMTAENIAEAHKKATLSVYEYDVYLAKKKSDDILAVNNLSIESRKMAEAVYRRDIEQADVKEMQRQAAYARDLETLKLSGMKEGIDRELAERKIAAQYERATLEKSLRESLEYRTALVRDQAKKEAEIRMQKVIEEMDKEVAFALKSTEEQIKYTTELEQARRLLADIKLNDLKNTNQAAKDLLHTEGGSEALQERIKVWREEALKIETEKALKAKEYVEFLKQGQEITEKITKEKGIKEFGISKEAFTKIEEDVKISITISNLGELGNKVAEVVRNEVKKHEKDIEDAVTTNVGESMRKSGG